jgi:predicted RNA-binding Zn-ribbon protein involved in translation (DUF1610 family)
MNNMPGDELKKEKVRSMLTPEVLVCGSCQQKYSEQASCAGCGKNMLSPGYNGMVYECPLCGELYFENCWDTMEEHH